MSAQRIAGHDDHRGISDARCASTTHRRSLRLGVTAFLVASLVGVTACSHSNDHAGGGASETASGAASPSAKPTHESSSKQTPRSKTSKSAPAKKGSRNRHSPKSGSAKTGGKSPSGGKAESDKRSPSASPGAHTSKTPSNDTYDDTSDTGAKAPDDQHKAVQKLPGSKAKNKDCVNVGKKTDVRSKKIAMGNFANARKTFKQAKSAYDSDPLQMYVIPTSRTKAGVKVTASLKGSNSKPVKVKSKQFSRAAQWKYYPVEIKLARSGTWRFNVASAQDHGCFEARFTS